MDVKDRLLQFAKENVLDDYETTNTELAKTFPKHRTRVAIDRDTRATRLSVDDYTVEIPERPKDSNCRVVLADGGVYLNGKFTSKEALDEMKSWKPSEETAKEISEMLSREISENKPEDKI